MEKTKSASSVAESERISINVRRSVFEANDSVARANQRRMNEAGVLAVNLMSAPGSGKTTLLQRSMADLAPERCAVLVGDLQTSRDAERLALSAASVHQINTGKGCHLTARQVSEGLTHLELHEMSYLFIENVGNMVCPASYHLGEHFRVAALSVPEGDDKVAKYPTLFQAVDAILLTKVELIGLLDFEAERVISDLSQVNALAPLFMLSSKTGEGMVAWLDWLRARREQVLRGG